MDLEQRNILQNYTVAMRQRLRELDEYGNAERTLETLKQLEGLARNARDKIGNLEVQTKLQI